MAPDGTLTARRARETGSRRASGTTSLDAIGRSRRRLLQLDGACRRTRARPARGWRARTSSVAVDLPPSPPTGLAAVPGDRAGEPHLERQPRARRGRLPRLPRPARAVVPTACDRRDRRDASPRSRALTNGVTVYYVVTALDARFESGYSAEVAATPTAPRTIEAEVRYAPDRDRRRVPLRASVVPDTGVVVGGRSDRG